MSLTPSLMERKLEGISHSNHGREEWQRSADQNNSRLPRMICAQSVPFVLLNAGSVSSKHSHGEKEKTKNTCRILSLPQYERETTISPTVAN